MKSLREFAIYFLIQALSYSLIVYNFRMIAQERLAPALVSDAIYASFTFFVIRRIARSEDSVVGWMGYVVGSLVGTTVGIYF